MYTDHDFPTKKALKEAVAAGKRVTYYQPGPYEPQDGTITVAGPHYPKAHTWYAECTVQNGVIVKVR